jgi:hypothetical protein
LNIFLQVEAFLGISPDSIVLVQDNLHRDILFLTATKSVIGWTALQNSIRIFFHQACIHRNLGQPENTVLTEMTFFMYFFQISTYNFKLKTPIFPEIFSFIFVPRQFEHF